MADVKRVCGCCHVDQTQYGGGLSKIVNWHGNPVGLVGTHCNCHQEVRRMLNNLASQYGGYVDEGGNVFAGPIGSPDVRSFDALREAIGECTPGACQPAHSAVT